MIAVTNNSLASNIKPHRSTHSDVTENFVRQWVDHKLARRSIVLSAWFVQAHVSVILALFVLQLQSDGVLKPETYLCTFNRRMFSDLSLGDA